MPKYAAISGLEDLDQVRVALIQGENVVHTPAVGLGQALLQLNATPGIVVQTDADSFTKRTLTGTANQITIVDGDGVAGNPTFSLASSLILFGKTIDILTPWVSYTPTFTSFGTVSAVSVWSRRVGDTLCLRGKFTSGTSTAVESRMTLGFNGTNANVNSDATKVPALQVAGYGSRAQAATTLFDWRVLIESNVGYVTFGHQLSTTSALNKQLGNAWIASGEAYHFIAEIPISGW